MDDLEPASVSVILAKLFGKLKALEDRVSVLETCTQNYQSRLEDIENWQDAVDDKLDA